ncbi:hypothetical protein BMS3Bbin04_01489 [bacterium BMS3Bbin04]|nr:hypothetical protein BMS3Bbin04_01489 [bacterium BMS3Bbin04]
MDFLLRHVDPAVQRFVVWEQLLNRGVGGVDILWIAGYRAPAERAFPFAEQVTDVCWHESREGERVFVSHTFRLPTQVVAVVKGNRALFLHLDHRLTMDYHRFHRPLFVIYRVGFTQLERVLIWQTVGNVAV